MAKRTTQRTLAYLAGNPWEEDEQAAFLDWFRVVFPSQVIFSVPNAGKRKAGMINQLKREGLLPAAPDLVIMGWKLAIEMKRKNGRGPTVDQQTVHAALRDNGVTVLVCYGADDAKRQVEQFVKERRGA